MTCLDRNVPPFLGAKETCLEHLVFSLEHTSVMITSNIVWVARILPAKIYGPDCSWLKYFYFQSGKHCQRHNRPENRVFLLNQLQSEGGPNLTLKVKAVQWVGGAYYSYLHFNFMLAAIASRTNETTMVGGSIGNVINISISIVIKYLFNSLSDLSVKGISEWLNDNAQQRSNPSPIKRMTTWSRFRVSFYIAHRYIVL